MGMGDIDRARQFSLRRIRNKNDPVASSAPAAPTGPAANQAASYEAPGRAASYLAYDAAPNPMDEEDPLKRKGTGSSGMSLSRRLLLGSAQQQTLG